MIAFRRARQGGGETLSAQEKRTSWGRGALHLGGWGDSKHQTVSEELGLARSKALRRDNGGKPYRQCTDTAEWSLPVGHSLGQEQPQHPQMCVIIRSSLY